MGRLWLAICAALLCSSAARAGYSTSAKDLERAAELAVERAAEKVAERAVEKALNSGNSSTITVTVKEAYENTKKTAEEAAVPGSESTRPYDPIDNRQYAYEPPAEGEYRVSDSAEAEELGVSKESLNSSVENLGSGEVAEGSAEDREPDDDLPLEHASFESVKDSLGKTTESPAQDFDVSLGLDFGLDFGSLDMSGDFGSKSSASSKTETYTSSYSVPPKRTSPGDEEEIDDDEDAEIFGMYSDFDSGSGWSSVKQKGWVRHRPLWDDSKSWVSREKPWEELMTSAKSDERQRAKQSPDKPRLFKRNAAGDDDDYEAAAESAASQVAVPLASLSLDPKAPALLYRLLQKELKYSTHNYSAKSPIPMRLYVTVPLAHLRAANNHQNDKEVTHITPRPYRPTIAPRQINDEESAESKKPVKRSNDFDFGTRTYGSLVNRGSNFQKNQQSLSGRQHRSLVKVMKNKLELKSTTTAPILEIARVKPKA